MSVAGEGNSGGTSAESGGEPSGGTSFAGSNTGGTLGGNGTVGGPMPALGAQRAANKVDLLLAIDNSRSMAQKHKLLAEALPELVERLVNPPCVAASGNVVSQPASPSVACPGVSEREIEPVRDLHIGAITSSLGSHGGTQADPCNRPEDDDHAYLLPFVRDGLPSYDGQGYLKWDPEGVANPPGENDVQALMDAVRLTVAGAGEDGCGYEAQLESVYRFLVEPEPYQSLVRNSDQLTEKVGIDADLLQQRAAFLRPDSSVVVLMLTDENDCSVLDEGYGWLVTRNNGKYPGMFRSTSQCLTNANDACCQSCGEPLAHDGCPVIESDVECKKGQSLEPEDDSLNLRCFDQKRRFGLDLLYPTDRYVRAFGAGDVLNRAGGLVDNPLFKRGKESRDPSLFTFAVIGGVPWQDLATTASLGDPTLRLLTASQLESQNRWPLLIGNVAANVAPQDPFMRESVEPRLGKNPITGENTQPESSVDPAASSINGHEHDTMGIELQYACTFDLPEPVECSEARQAADGDCECYADDLPMNRSVCNPPGGGEASTTQYKGKAYPSLRELRVARELGRRTVLGSVCSRNTMDEEDGDYGYRPVIGAIGDRLVDTLEKP